MVKRYWEISLNPPMILSCNLSKPGVMGMSESEYETTILSYGIRTTEIMTTSEICRVLNACGQPGYDDIRQEYLCLMRTRHIIM